ncbi:olfactory receptor 5B12-like [Sarcophilus harrisii]|uniref:G-protein coupled receptors family 1 profile domain-containing protein n=1 Tax=Sarcophilus harrisii TaxID=9305 RepID=A0A7N4P3S0_SARHA|nr:olfactory receptor 5B12-like [Sarcophilus harrisii]
MENCSEVKEFILVGLTDTPELQVPLFIIFTIIYLITVVGNLGLITLILGDSHLHTPMYFFLSNLSLVDFGYSSTITPKVMTGLLPGDKTISYSGCATQMYFFVYFATIESYLLAAMAYDRQVAVCKPLHYTTTMTSSVCTGLSISSHICGFIFSSIHTGNTFSLHFCNSNTIHHFFCDIPALLVLSHSVSYIHEVVIFFAVGFNVFFALFFILKSYFFIFIAILRMRSAEGCQKAFSTCASHLTAVSIFYGTVIFMYLQPSSRHSLDIDKMASVFYTMVIPMLNPLVYSLRNKEVSSALRKIIDKTTSSLGISF